MSRWLTIGTLSLLAAAVPGCARKSPRGLVLITIDTCRADRLGCYGADRPATPALDGLALRGSLFEHVSAPVPLTLPSHCSVMTGLYPDRHTVRDNGAARLPESADTLAEILRDTGWSTAAFVSAFPLEHRFGVEQGFDLYDDDFSRPAAGTGMGERTDEVASRLFYDERRATDVTDRALPWLREAARGSRPFFAWIHFFDPHAAYQAPARFASIYGADSYEAEVAYVDEQIGRVLAELRDLHDRVQVVVTADHGESLGQHEEATHGLFVYESTLRVPWILAGPGIPQGKRVATPVSLVDVTPTLLDLLDLPALADPDGESLLPLLTGGGDAPPTVHAECLYPRIHYRWAALRSVRKGNWKYIDAPTPELYDLAEDPDELVNLAAGRPDLTEELRSEIRLHAARGEPLAAETLEVDDATVERLEHLGYVGTVRRGTAVDGDDPFGAGGRDPKEMVGFFNRLQEIPTLMLAGRYDEAGRRLDELHAIDPGNANVLVKLALLRRVEEKWDEAAHWCREVLRIDPTDNETRLNLGSALVQLGDRKGALDAYAEVVSRDPRHAEAWERMAGLYADEGRHDDARLAYETAVSLTPDDPDVQVSFAQALEDAGDTTGALVRYGRALELDPGAAAAVNGKALLLSHAGRAREAARVLREALPALHDSLDALNNLAWILANGDIDPRQAYEYAKRARALSPNDPAVADTFGWAAIRAGHPAEAVEPLRAALRDTGDAEVKAHLGIALAESGREEEGKKLVRAALEERPSLADVPEAARWNLP